MVPRSQNGLAPALNCITTSRDLVVKTGYWLLLPWVWGSVLFLSGSFVIASMRRANINSGLDQKTRKHLWRTTQNFIPEESYQLCTEFCLSLIWKRDEGYDCNYDWKKLEHRVRTDRQGCPIFHSSLKNGILCTMGQCYKLNDANLAQLLMQRYETAPDAHQTLGIS